MASADILLLTPIQGLGGEGDEVKVRAGYARNYLLPRKLAILVSYSNRNQIKALQAARTQREAKELEHANELVSKLGRVGIALAVKTGEGGKMFGAVTAQDLFERLAQEGITLEKRQLSLHHPIKTLGKHSVKIKLHPQVSYDLAFEIVSENPIDVEE